jgi:hypothetical protein
MDGDRTIWQDRHKFLRFCGWRGSVKSNYLCAKAILAVPSARPVKTTAYGVEFFLGFGLEESRKGQDEAHREDVSLGNFVVTSL